MHKEKISAQSKMVQYQSESASHAPLPSKGSIALTQNSEHKALSYECG